MTGPYFARTLIEKADLKKRLPLLKYYCVRLGFSKCVPTWDERFATSFSQEDEIMFHPPRIFSGQGGSEWPNEAIDLFREEAYSKQILERYLRICMNEKWPNSSVTAFWRQNEQAIIARLAMSIQHRPSRSDDGELTTWCEIEFSYPFAKYNNLYEVWSNCYRALTKELWNYVAKFEKFGVGATLPRPDLETMEKLGLVAEQMDDKQESLSYCFNIPKLAPQVALEIFQRALRVLQSVVCDPSELQLDLFLCTQTFPSYLEEMGDEPLNYYSTTYEKRRGFDPYKAPLPPEVTIEVYPQIILKRYDFNDRMLPYTVLLATNLVRTSEGCFLEFQSTRSVQWLEFAAHLIGQPIEIWEGAMNERWGWYEPSSNPNAIRIYDPTGKPAIRPHFDHPDLRSPNDENALFDRADKENKFTSVAAELSESK